MVVLIDTLLVLTAGVLPMVVYALVLWWFDRYEKEPLLLLLAAFLWGAIPAVFFSAIAQLVLDTPIEYFVSPASSDLVGGILIAPLTEETFKGAALLILLLFFHREIDSPLDGIIYGGLAGFGFAAVENVLYFGSVLVESGPGVLALNIVFRACVFGLNHALFTGLTGLGLALARTESNLRVRIGAPIAGWLLGMAAHGVHNAGMSRADLCLPCLLAFAADWGGVLILLVVIVWASLREQRLIAAYLADEVQRGTLSKEAYDVVCSYLLRVAAGMNALFTGKLGRWWSLGRYYRLATELAFNKHRLTRFSEEHDTLERIDRLRGQTMGLGKRLGLG
jgi:RsiW-degrading membrane proteinase PrsW (M82 family)